ncbi:hypothetical protein GCM10009814_40390 [Lapillicoccus jejuensis]
MGRADPRGRDPGARVVRAVAARVVPVGRAVRDDPVVPVEPVARDAPVAPAVQAATPVRAAPTSVDDRTAGTGRTGASVRRGTVGRPGAVSVGRAVTTTAVPLARRASPSRRSPRA